MTRRGGAVSLPELVLTLLLFAMIMAGAAEFLVQSARLASAQRDQLRFMELARSARVILRGELRALAPADIAVATGDSVRLRAFRGGGRVCGRSGAEVWLRYSGSRAPDPSKDSIVLITGTGVEEVRMVTNVSGAPCPGGVALRLAGTPVSRAAYGLVFETGAYHFWDGALRYRRGAGGRQPLTESLLVEPAFGGTAAPDLHVALLPRLDSLRSGSARARSIEVHGLNASDRP